MDKAKMRKTEWRLTQYYRRKNAIGRFERMLTKGRERMVQIEKDIKNCNYTIENPLGSVVYDGMPRGNQTPGSAIERSLIRAHEQLETELCRLIEREALLITQITRTRDSVDLMEEALCILDDEQILHIELRYGKGWAYRQMEETLMMEHSTIHRRNGILMEKLTAELERMGETLLAQYDQEIEEDATN